MHLLINNNNGDDEDALPPKVQPLYSVFPAWIACVSEIASHRNAHPHQPIYSLVQYADGARVNTCFKENLQANVELTYFTSAYIILGLTLNPNKRKHSSSQNSRKHSCHPTKAQPTIDPLKMITSRQFSTDRLPANVKVTGLMYSA